MNRVVHFEIHASDMERAKKFYHDCFGWQMQQMGSEYGDYVVLMTGPGPDDMAKGGVKMEDMGINGGMMLRRGPSPAPDAPVSSYVCIIGVDNIDTYISKVEAAGAVLALAKMEVPNVGHVAYYRDTEGNLFGMIQPIMPAK